MNPSICLRWLLVLCFSGLALIRADDDTAKNKATDIAQMKKIFDALTAYKKAKGDFPPHLSDLVPEYLPDAKVLLSPLDVADPPAPPRGRDPKLACSYRYEFNGDQMGGNGKTMRDVKTAQVEEYGPIVPMLRCALYNSLINVSYAGEVFETGPVWETDPFVKARLEKDGLGPGVKVGKTLTVQVVNPDGQPIAKANVWATGRFFCGNQFPERGYLTDADGKVTIPLGADPKPAVTIQSRSDDWYFPNRRWAFGDEGTGPDDSASLKLTFFPAGTVGAVVRDAQGVVLKDALVHVTFAPDPARPNDPDKLLVRKQTGADGRFTAPGVPRGNPSLRIAIRHPAGRTLTLSPSAPGETSEALFAQKADLRLPPLIPITGVVTSQGRPVAGVKLYLQGRASAIHQATTDAAGRYAMGAQEPGKWILLAVAKELAPKREAFELAEEPKTLDLELDAGRALSVRVVFGARTPVRDLPIVLMSVLGGPPRANPRPATLYLPDKPVLGTTDAEGRFVWKHSPRDLAECALLMPSGEFVQFEWDGRKDDEVIVKVQEK